VNATGNGFHFGEFRHGFILGDWSGGLGLAGCGRCQRIRMELDFKPRRGLCLISWQLAQSNESSPLD
jgi:hypothetical protein